MMEPFSLQDPIDDTNYSEFNKKVREFAASEHELERYEERSEDCSLSSESREHLFQGKGSVHYWPLLSNLSRRKESPLVYILVCTCAEQANQIMLNFETAKYNGKANTCWKGLPCIKDPCTLVILQQLLWDIKPATILEFGANSGGSAFYMADMMKSYGFKTHVYSMDINLELLGPLAREKREDITFFQGDCKKVEETFPHEFLKELPHPWFVLDDAHVNTFGVFDYLDQFTMPGDYLLWEDTDLTVPSKMDTLEGSWGRQKILQLAAFIKKYSERYRVDKRYTDFYGYNGSFNLNGFLKRI